MDVLDTLDNMRSVIIRKLKLLLKILSSMLILPCLTGCLGVYLVKSGYNQMQLLSAREPIEKIIRDPKTSPELKSKLELTLDVRRFLAEKLKLKSTKNYTTYVDIGRPHVTNIVTVAYKDKLKSKPYWYPLVGELPYKGFFDREDAIAEAQSFDPQIYDTMVRGVSAYSTLGWFEDPLLSSMLSSRDDHLVNTLIHESTHATLFIKSNAEFNERLATFVGNVGTELYFRDKEGAHSPTLAKIADENADEKLFSEFISEEIKSLKQWYATSSQPKGVSLEAARLSEFQLMQERFQKNVAPRLKTPIYSGFANAKLNNAILLYYGTYVQNLDQFEKLYQHFKGDFAQFIDFCKTLQQERDPLHALETFLPSSSTSPSAGPARPK